MDIILSITLTTFLFGAFEFIVYLCTKLKYNCYD